MLILCETTRMLDRRGGRGYHEAEGWSWKLLNKAEELVRTITSFTPFLIMSRGFSVEL